MNSLLAIFVSWQFIFLCCGISAVSFVIRSIIETLVLNNPNLPGNKNSRYWETFLLLFPVFLGFIFPFVAKSFSYPNGLTDVYAKFLFSASAGLFSPTAYRILKGLLWAQVVSNQNVMTDTNQSSVQPSVVIQVPPSQAPAPAPNQPTIVTSDDVSPPEPKL